MYEHINFKKNLRYYGLIKLNPPFVSPALFSHIFYIKLALSSASSRAKSSLFLTALVYVLHYIFQGGKANNLLWAFYVGPVKNKFAISTIDTMKNAFFYRKNARPWVIAPIRQKAALMIIDVLSGLFCRNTNGGICQDGPFTSKRYSKNRQAFCKHTHTLEFVTRYH